MSVSEYSVTSATPSRENVGKMFDRIAPRYDLLNRLLSLRRDVAWRKKIAEHLPAGENLTVLDLATGTADVLLSLCENNRRVSRGIGVDVAPKMLRIGRDKIAAERLSDRLRLFPADALALPFRENHFDAVTIAFGIRNVLDVSQALREMYRVLRPGGRVLILEFSLPGNKLFRQVYLFYFRYILPRVGGLISGDNSAYRYLNRTVETFPYGEDFLRLLQDSGFEQRRAIPLTGGIATLYRGDKPLQQA